MNRTQGRNRAEPIAIFGSDRFAEIRLLLPPKALQRHGEQHILSFEIPTLTTADRLIAAAAMYQAKQQHKHCYELFRRSP